MPIVVTVLVFGVVVGGWLLWRRYKGEEPPPAETAQAPPPEMPMDAAPPADAMPSGPRYPIEAADDVPKRRSPSADPDERVRQALIATIGRTALRNYFKVENFAHNVVATVDNLGRETASPSMWPVNRTGGPFMTESNHATTIAAKNAQRYAPFIHQMSNVNTSKVVALYVDLYPQLQKAFEEMGYPGVYFNDRVVEVIDLMLETPRVDGPIAVKRPGDGAEGGATAASNLYQLADPQLESLAAGQKILLRIGTENANAVRAKLTDLRHQITARKVTGALSP